MMKRTGYSQSGERKAKKQQIFEVVILCCFRARKSYLRLGRLGGQSSAQFKKVFVYILAVYQRIDCFLKHRTLTLLEELGQTPEKDC